MTDATPERTDFGTLSKRAARRLIQRALILVGRNRTVRQTLRAAQLNSHWSIDDNGVEWTVQIERGRPEFCRGHIGQPQVILRWHTAEDFARHIASGIAPAGWRDLEASPGLRRLVDTVFGAFAKSLLAVLANPIDDDGERLV